MVVLRGAQSVGLGPHLSTLIYIYKSKITKYMYMVQCPIHRIRKVVLHHHWRALWKSLVGSFCMKNFISTKRNVIHIFTKAHILFCLPCSRYILLNLILRFQVNRITESWGNVRWPKVNHSQKSWVLLLMNIHKPNRFMYDISK